MGELLCAIEDGRQPSHSARNNLRSLELCFAAVASSMRHEVVVPGTVRSGGLTVAASTAEAVAASTAAIMAAVTC